MSVHYVEHLPLNVPAAVRVGAVKRAKKRIRSMSPSQLTFNHLLDFTADRVRRGDGPSASSLPNLVSALKSFLQQQELLMTSPVGSVFRASYYRRLKSHLEALRADGRSNEYISNRKGLLRQWRISVILFDQTCAAAQKIAHPFQVGIQDILGTVSSQADLARESGISVSTLKRWAAGSLPNSASLRHVAKLERHLGLDSGFLGALLPQQMQPRARQASLPDSEQIAYRADLADRVKEPYLLKDANERLRKQWGDYVEHKVGGLAAAKRRNDDDGEDELKLQRSKRSYWATAELSRMTNREKQWFAIHKGRYVATASIAWSRAASFLGWLMLGEDKGGKGFTPEEAHTLANLHRRGLVCEYVDWAIQRSGGKVHEGILTFLVWVKALCNPATGYLTQRGREVANVGDVYDEDLWRRRCMATFTAVCEDIEELKKRKTISRNPMEPIQQVLALQNPLEAVADMVVRMRVTRPSTKGSREAVWARDILFVKLLASNPLRIKNMRSLTYTADNRGHLRQDSTGAWFIYVPKDELKNRDGAAKEKDYHMPVRPEVWGDIEEYFKHYRPMLAKHQTDIFFISEATGREFHETALGRRFELLARKYLQGCPGVGPHAMRHIVATSILKANPNDWAGAAMALHDREETVKKHYAHLAQNDAARWLDKTLAGPFSRM